MNIGCAFFNRIEQYLVNKAYDRCVFDFIAILVVIKILVIVAPLLTAASSPTPLLCNSLPCFLQESASRTSSLETRRVRSICGSWIWPETR